MLISSAQARSSCASGLTACPDLPFCCAAGSSCLALAGNSTVLCCPEGANCAQIKPITCDLAKQDSSKAPDAPIKTTLLTGVKLPVCGNLCCPFGYSCSGSDCIKDTDQSKLPPGASSTATASATATTATTASSTVSATHSASSTAAAEAAAGPGPAKASIIAGAVGGAFALVVLLVVVVLCVRRRQSSSSDKGTDNRSIQSSKTYANISGPIMDPSSCRTDFIRKSPRASQRYSIPNPFDSPSESTFVGGDARSSHVSADGRARLGSVPQLQPIRAMKASSSYSACVRREPSSECINVFADPQTVTNGDPNRLTTFSDLMVQANMRDVERTGYVPHVPGTTPKI